LRFLPKTEPNQTNSEPLPQCFGELNRTESHKSVMQTPRGNN